MKIGYSSEIVLLIRLFSRYSLLLKNKLFSRVRILYHMIYHVYKYRSCVYHTHDVSVFFLVTCSDFQRKARLSRNFYFFKHQGGFNSENNNIFHIMYLLQNYYDQHYSIATLIYWHHHNHWIKLDHFGSIGCFALSLNLSDLSRLLVGYFK